MNRTHLTMAAAAALATAAAWAQSPLPDTPTRLLTAGVHQITAEVASDERAREVGLMYRSSLPPNHGMLFVFDQPFEACMWMRNTLIPLSVAFLDGEGRVVNIEEMQPRTENVHCAKRAVPYALEMASGWFSERGLKAGQTVIGGLPKPAAN
jgi:uncharacterized membrane protein (UPF0127 family)